MNLVSDRVLRKDADDGHLYVFLFQVLLELRREDPAGQEGQEDEEQVAKLTALLPRRDLTWVRLLVQVVDSTVQPMPIAVDVELLKVPELVHRVMLQVMRHDLVLLGRLRLVFETVLRHDARRLEGNEVFGVVARDVVERKARLLLLQKQRLHSTLH